jgi:hypothetical protein
MYATSVGLIMRGFEYLDMYKKTFNAGNSEDFVKPKAVIIEKKPELEVVEEEEAFIPRAPEEEKIPLTEKIKSMLSKMFEVEDQPIK